MNNDDPDVSGWIGRSEESRNSITPGPLKRLSAMLDSKEAPFTAGAVIPAAVALDFLPDADATTGTRSGRACPARWLHPGAARFSTADAGWKPPVISAGYSSG